MSAPYLTYKALRYQTALGIGSIATSSGDVTSTADQDMLAVFLSNAAAWAYLPPNRRVLWPDTLSSGTITLTSGAFDISSIGDAIRASLWNADPRPVGASAYPVAFTQVGDSIYPQNPGLSSVYAFWQGRPPQFTNTVYAGGTTYAKHDLVYVAADGECYRSLQASNTGHTPSSSPTWWEPQRVIGYLSQPIQNKATAFYLDSIRQTEIANEKDRDAGDWLSQAWMAAQKAAPEISPDSWATLGTWR